MSNDPYAACICGSGKKLKFCCQDIIADMQRIEQLRDNQPDVAIQQLRSLYESHPDKDVLVIELCELVSRMGQPEEARELCVEYLRRHPDEPRITILLADHTLQTDGFHAARRLVHRAIQLAQTTHHQSVAMLLASIADEMLRVGNPASAYAHLRRAIQFAPDRLRSSLEMLLSSWTTRISEYFPLLGTLELMDVELSGEAQEIEQKARRLNRLACWEPSAILYTRLVRQFPDNAALWHNLGLFQLWDDRLSQAAECLHKAAELIEDFDSAVEAETLAVLLDLEVSDDRRCTMESSRQIQHPRELSSRLKEHGRFVLSGPDTPLDATEMSHHHLRIFADTPPEDDGAQLELGAVTITANFDGQADQHIVTVSAGEDRLQDAWAVVLEAGGDCFGDDDETTEATIGASIPTCFQDFDWDLYFSPGISTRQLRASLDTRIQAALEAWLARPQVQLDNLSPQQAAEKPEMKVRTAASVLVLHAIAQRLNHEIRTSDVRDRLNVPAPQLRTLPDDRSLEGVPLLHYLRLSLPDLTDAQVLQFAHRVGLVRDVDLLEQVVEELFRRPDALELFTLRRAHMMKALVARFRNRIDEMAESFDAARQASPEQADGFQARLELDLKELSYRLDDPDDPGIVPLLHSMRDQYFQKVPEVAEGVRQELLRSGCDHLLSELDAPLIVTAGQESGPASSGKLWLPGQD